MLCLWKCFGLKNRDDYKRGIIDRTTTNNDWLKEASVIRHCTDPNPKGSECRLVTVE